MAFFSRALRRVFQQEEPHSSSHIQQLRRLPSQTATSRFGSSISSPGDSAQCFHTYRPVLSSYGPQNHNRHILSMKRPHTALAGSRTPLAEIQNVDSQDNIPRIRKRKPTGQVVPWKRQLSSSQSLKNTESQQWSHRLYKTEEGKPIMVHYCGSLATTEKAAQYFVNEPILGFDMEWQWNASTYQTIQENVSVIQLASRNRIAIFHIAQFKPCLKLEEFVSPTLKGIIENPNITKTGVNIKGDCTRLRKHLGIDARGTFELSHMFKLIKYCYTMPKMINKYRVSLADQVQAHFGIPLAKERDVRCSDWKKPITAAQAHYAAADAYAGYQLYITMDEKRRALRPVPPLPAHDELSLPILTYEPPPPPADAPVKPVTRRERAASVDSGVKCDPESMKAAVKSRVATRRRAQSVDSAVKPATTEFVKPTEKTTVLTKRQFHDWSYSPDSKS